MEKELIKRIIAEKQAEIAQTALIRRPIVLEPTANYVFVGLRRAGKSSPLMKNRPSRQTDQPFV